MEIHNFLIAIGEMITVMSYVMGQRLFRGIMASLEYSYGFNAS